MFIRSSYLFNTSVQLPGSTVTIVNAKVYFLFYCQRVLLSHAVTDAMFSDDNK